MNTAQAIETNHFSASTADAEGGTPASCGKYKL
jgi:hypothetical protein